MVSMERLSVLAVCLHMEVFLLDLHKAADYSLDVSKMQLCTIER